MVTKSLLQLPLRLLEDLCFVPLKEFVIGRVA